VVYAPPNPIGVATQYNAGRLWSASPISIGWLGRSDLMPPPSFLDDPLQAIERLVPPPRDLVDVPARIVDLARLKLPDPLPPAPDAADEARSGQDVQVLGDGLAGDDRAGGEPCDRQRAACAKPGHEREPGVGRQK